MASVTGLTGGWSEGITSSQWQDRRSCDEIILGKTVQQKSGPKDEPRHNGRVEVLEGKISDVTVPNS